MFTCSRLSVPAPLPAMPLTYPTTVRLQLASWHRSSPPRISVASIIAAVASRTGLTRNDIVSARRSPRHDTARQAVYLLARILTDLSLPQIGRAIGDRDHSTVHHGIGRAQARLGEPDFADLVAAAERALKNEPSA
jgi:chromosomal replication initiator protein